MATRPQTAGVSPEPAAATPELSPAFSPLYQQIKALLMASLQKAEWRPGELIPSEQELAARYKVSQGTVRKAIDELAAENLLTRKQGKGTYVATHHEPQVQYRFLRLQPDNLDAEPMTREVLECKRVRAPADVARQLGLKSGDTVVQIKRLLRFAGKVVVFDDIYLPASRFKGMSAERLTAYTGPLYALFEAEFGTRMIRADEKIRAVNSDEVISALVSVAANTALLKVERTSYTYGDQPVEVRHGYYVTAQHYYRNEMQ